MVSDILGPRSQQPADTRSNSSRDSAAISATSTAGTTSSTTTSTAPTDTVHLSSDSRSLAALEAKVQAAADMDEAKVARLKDAVADGSYQVDSENMADKMLSMDAQFSR